MISQKELEILTAFLVERRSHRWIETHIMGLESKGNWGGTKAKDHLWKFGFKDVFKNFLADVHTEQELEEKLREHSDEIKSNKVDADLLMRVWNSAQHVYLFQRIIHNDNCWVRPSEGRLGFPADGSYLQDNGLGHEDWNFNTDLTIDNQVYGYLYYAPAVHKQNKKFNIVFATLDDGRWNVVGFYQNARFVPEGCPLDKKVFSRKVADLEFLRDQRSLGDEWNIPKAKIESKLRDEFRALRWRVHFKDIVVLPAPIDVSKDVDLPKNNRITTCTSLSEEVFFRILQIAKSTVPTIQGALTADEEENRKNRILEHFSDEDEEEFPEGKVFYRKHRFRERNTTVVKNAKAAFLKKHGKLFCECCTFNFEERYGSVGAEFIEAHHVIPVSDLNHSGKTKVEDIALVCSNCHRMIHRKRPWLSLDKLKSLLQKRPKS